MRVRALSSLTFLVIATLAAPAMAADIKDEARMRKFMYAYATCVVRASHAQPSKAVLSISNNDDVMSQFPELVSSNCLNSAAKDAANARFPSGVMQGALAEALVNADFSGRGDTSFANRLPLAQPAAMTEAEKVKAFSKAWSKKSRAAVQLAADQQVAIAWMAHYGECVVCHDPEYVRFWLLTPADTPEETSRIRALQPAFGGCLGSGTIKFNRVTMRSSVAVNYYRLAMATMVPGVGSVH